MANLEVPKFSSRHLAVIQTDDASAIGAAIFYLKAINVITDYSGLQPDNSTIIEPDMNNHDVYKKCIVKN